MAWLITLALFWAVGSIIASGIDGLKKSDYERAKENNDNYRKYFDNIYVLAWYYYQQFEPQVFQAFAEDRRNIPDYVCIPGGSSFEKFSEDVFGVGIQKKSVIEAIRLAIQLKLPIYIRNQGREKYEWGAGFVLAEHPDSIDIDFEATELIAEVSRIGRSYKLGFAYQWERLQSVDRELLSEYIPKEWDPRTYVYRMPVHEKGNIRWWATKRIGAQQSVKSSAPRQKESISDQIVHHKPN